MTPSKPLSRKYGIPYQTIRYYRDQATSMYRHCGILWGGYAFKPHSLDVCDSRTIGHYAIAVAAVLTPTQLKALLS